MANIRRAARAKPHNNSAANISGDRIALANWRTVIIDAQIDVSEKLTLRRFSPVQPLKNEKFVS